MITEDYVSFENAKLLKEKGFDAYGDGSYDSGIEIYKEYSPVGKLNSCATSKPNKRACPAPTLQMATKWLREIHNLHIMVDCIGAENYIPTIQFTRNSKDIEIKSKISKIGGNGFDSYEQAINAAIKYCLENLI